MLLVWRISNEWKCGRSGGLLYRLRGGRTSSFSRIQDPKWGGKYWHSEPWDYLREVKRQNRQFQDHQPNIPSKNQMIRELYNNIIFYLHQSQVAVCCVYKGLVIVIVKMCLTSDFISNAIFSSSSFFRRHGPVPVALAISIRSVLNVVTPHLFAFDSIKTHHQVLNLTQWRITVT
jgi:hypothetical protein